MAYCKHCGAEIGEGAAFCPKCGQPQSSAPQQQMPPNWQQPQQTPPSAPVDSGSIGWGVLGFCIPIVGLILFLVWKDQKPRTAKVAGMGALISVIVAVVWYILVFVLAFLFA